jgi:thiol:disulfide interchange protein DsbA
MKRFVTPLFLCALLWPPAGGAVEFTAGVHYQELPFPQPVETGDKIEVREFFWYGCQHCYRLEPALNSYLKKLPRNAKFVRTPGVSPDWLIHAQAYYAFESLGAVPRLHGPFFEAWHAQKRKLSDEKSIADFVAEHGVDRNKFLQAFRSFGVRLKVEKAKQLNFDFVVHAVPQLAVDGKYSTNPVMAGGEAEAMKVVDFLIQKAAGERRKPSAPR